MTLIDFIFFFYMFIGLYMLSLLCFIYYHSRDKMFSYPKWRGKLPGVSIVVPCYNEGESIGRTIESLLTLEYGAPIEIIVVDDRSKDNSAQIAKRYTERYDNVRLIVNKRNSGGAAEPTNIGVMNAKYDYIAVADADSTPERDALAKMIGFLQEEKVAAVTCAVLAKSEHTFMQKLQTIEYTIIA